MATILSLEEINEVARLDLETDGNTPPEFTDARTPMVQAFLNQADDIVRTFLKVEAEDWPPDEVPERYKAAVTLCFLALFDDMQEWIAGLQETPPGGPVAAVLRLDRMPTLA